MALPLGLRFCHTQAHLYLFIRSAYVSFRLQVYLTDGNYRQTNVFCFRSSVAEDASRLFVEFIMCTWLIVNYDSFVGSRLLIVFDCVSSELSEIKLNVELIS